MSYPRIGQPSWHDGLYGSWPNRIETQVRGVDSRDADESAPREVCAPCHLDSTDKQGEHGLMWHWTTAMRFPARWRRRAGLTGGQGFRGQIRGWVGRGPDRERPFALLCPACSRGRDSALDGHAPSMGLAVLPKAVLFGRWR